MILRTRDNRVFEALISGEKVDDEEFVDLSRVLVTLSRVGTDIGVEGNAAVFAEDAARLARSGKGKATPSEIKPQRGSLIPRLATAALAVVTLFGLTGIAVASDAAGPGDTLYGVDQALERVGFNNGGLEERIAEATDMVASGSPAGALAHLADSLKTTSSDAADALEHAADTVRNSASDNGRSQVVRDDVAGMLEWMATVDQSGRNFGQGVAEHARDIGKGNPDPGKDKGPPEDAGSNGNGNGNGNGPPDRAPPGHGH